MLKRDNNEMNLECNTEILYEHFKRRYFYCSKEPTNMKEKSTSKPLLLLGLLEITTKLP